MDKHDKKPGSVAELALIQAALNRHYPRPNIDQSQAFEAGWAECRASLQPTEQPATSTNTVPVRLMGEQPEAAQDERERFEAWGNEHMLLGVDAPSWDESRNCYVSASVHYMWKAWQAAKRDAAQAPQERAAVTILKQADCLQRWADLDAFWESTPYGNRFYFGDGAMDYVPRDVLRALLSLSAQSSEQEG